MTVRPDDSFALASVQHRDRNGEWYWTDMPRDRATAEKVAERMPRDQARAYLEKYDKRVSALSAVVEPARVAHEKVRAAMAKLEKARAEDREKAQNGTHELSDLGRQKHLARVAAEAYAEARQTVQHLMAGGAVPKAVARFQHNRQGALRVEPRPEHAEVRAVLLGMSEADRRKHLAAALQAGDLVTAEALVSAPLPVRVALDGETFTAGDGRRLSLLNDAEEVLLRERYPDADLDGDAHDLATGVGHELDQMLAKLAEAAGAQHESLRHTASAEGVRLDAKTVAQDAAIQSDLAERKADLEGRIAAARELSAGGFA
jgi:hypothetical protein